MKPKKKHEELALLLKDAGRPIKRDVAEQEFSEHAVRACIRDGSVVRLLPEVLVHRSLRHDPTVRVRAAALWMAPAGGALTGRAALWAWGVIKEPPSRVMVQVRHPLHRQAPAWIRPYRPRTAPAPIAVRGMLTVPLAHAVVHAWNETRGETALALVVTAIGGGHVSAADVAGAVALTGRVRARRGLVALLEELVNGITSYLEHRAKTRVFPPADFPELQWQVSMVVCGRDRTLDAFDPGSRTALEFDSNSWHGKVEDRVGDIERDAEFSSVGILSLRFDFFAIFNQPEWCQTIYRNTRAERLGATTTSGPGVAALTN